MGIGSNNSLFKLSYTVRPPAKEISRYLDCPPKKIPIFMIKILMAKLILNLTRIHMKNDFLGENTILKPNHLF